MACRVRCFFRSRSPTFELTAAIVTSSRLTRRSGGSSPAPPRATCYVLRAEQLPDVPRREWNPAGLLTGRVEDRVRDRGRHEAVRAFAGAADRADARVVDDLDLDIGQFRDPEDREADPVAARDRALVEGDPFVQ